MIQTQDGILTAQRPCNPTVRIRPNSPPSSSLQFTNEERTSPAPPGLPPDELASFGSFWQWRDGGSNSRVPCPDVDVGADELFGPGVRTALHIIKHMKQLQGGARNLKRIGISAKAHLQQQDHFVCEFFTLAWIAY